MSSGTTRRRESGLGFLSTGRSSMSRIESRRRRDSSPREAAFGLPEGDVNCGVVEGPSFGSGICIGTDFGVGVARRGTAAWAASVVALGTGNDDGVKPAWAGG